MEDSDIGIKSEPMTDVESVIGTERPLQVEVPDNVDTNSLRDDADNKNSFVANEPDDLNHKRSIISLLLQTSEGKEGDYWNVIPSDFLHEFLNREASSFDELKGVLGPINTELLVDSSGLLHGSEAEADKCAFVHPSIFHYLVTWFGLQGNPISRALLIDDNGNKIIERYPPYFAVHTLTTKAKVTNFHSHNQSPNGFFLSRISTFQDLVDTIKNNLFKNHKNEFRVWFISGDVVEEYPNQITLSQFINEIPMRSLVFKEILGDTLKQQQVNHLKHHLLVESQDKSLNYPISQYVNGIDYTSFDPENLMTSGGDVGLINLGNTCYMNSALQCLVHVPEINYYFYYNIFLKELNKTNPLGYSGNMAQAFGALLHKLFNDQSPTHQSSISPREFKYTIGHFSSMFQGYQQQDSQEFLSWLLDALHEDLNRIYDKPYLEKPELKDEEVNDASAIKRLADISWNQYKQRNDSAIIDLFSGLYQSVLVCPDCGKTSITYDPFNDLTLPLPVDKKWYHTFTVVNLDFSQDVPERMMKLQVELNKTSTFVELLEYLAKFLKANKSDIFIYELFNDYVYQDFQNNNKKYKFIPISEIINANDNIIVYVIPHAEDDMIVPVLNTVPDKDRSYNIVNIFGVPLFITLSEQEIRSFGKIRGKLEQVSQLLTHVDINEYYKTLKSSFKQFYTKKDFDMDSERETPSTSEDDIEQDDESYDSDVSLADPEISADFGFSIKYSNDPRYRPENRKKVHFPHLKPTLTGLATLSERLPEKKFNYYHYPNYKRDREYVVVDKNRETSESIDVEVDTPEHHENITPATPLGHQEEPLDDGKVEDNEEKSSIGDDNSETSENEALGSLFDSVSTLPKPTPAPEQEPVPEQESEREQESINNHPLFVKRNTLLVCEWNSEIYDHVFQVNKKWENLNEIPNPELEANRAKLIAKQKSTISLYDCLDNFNRPEVLGDQDLWFCPGCKDHKQATKTIKIWNTGDILTIHLKRFQVARSFSDKIDITIDFPIEGLDMSSYVNGQDNLVYDLVAVDNHYGGLGGGHYTASAKNFRDNKWYYYNDGRVTEIPDPKDCITGAAYLLFYRKRTNDKFLGGEGMNQLIGEGQKEFSQSLEATKENFLRLKEQTTKFDDKEESSSTDMEAESGEGESGEGESGEGESGEGESGEGGSGGGESESTTESSESTGSGSSTSNKKSRSPVIDEGSFDNKKRLLNKDKEITESD